MKLKNIYIVAAGLFAFGAGSLLVGLASADFAAPTPRQTGVKKASWRCHDGSTSALQAPAGDCYTSDLAHEKAERNCANKCDASSGKCGIMTYAVTETCGIL